MTIDRTRSWTRRGLTHPSPWGRSIPDQWASTELHFYSRVRAPNNNTIGGQGGRSVAEEYLTVWGHAELVVESGLQSSDGGTATDRRFYDVFLDLPLPPGATIPRKGDRLWFNDGLANKIDVAIVYVDLPEGSVDHLEIRTEDII